MFMMLVMMLMILMTVMMVMMINCYKRKQTCTGSLTHLSGEYIDYHNDWKLMMMKLMRLKDTNHVRKYFTKTPSNTEILKQIARNFP